MKTDTTNCKNPLIFSNFWLKIIAVFSMTLDHIGYMMQDYLINPAVANAFRVIGRLALPLFCFMIVEGVLHTKSFKKYVLRLGICLICVSIALLVVEYAPIFDGFSVRNEGNIFIDLLLGAVAVFLLSNKNKLIKLLAILPIGYSIASCIAIGLECVNCGIEVWFVPFFLRTQYGFYGVLLIILFYVGNLIADLYIKNIANGIYKDTIYERIAKNLFCILTLFISNLILFITSKNIPQSYLNYLDIEFEMLSLISAIFILLYNGKRGYNARWFKYGCYIYYALHMLIIYGLFAIIM